MDNFIIWGATGQAIVLEELLSSLGFKILVFFDNNSGVSSPFRGIPIYYGSKGFEEWLRGNTWEENIYFLLAIGGGNGKDKEVLFEYLTSKGIKAKSVKHNTAFVAYNATIGEGSQILANATVCAKVVLGKSVIINTASSVDHESIVEDFAHIGPGARICGCVKIGKYSFIGANATILPRIRIGNNSIIGAGTVVTKDVPDNVVYYDHKVQSIR